MLICFKMKEKNYIQLSKHVQNHVEIYCQVAFVSSERRILRFLLQITVCLLTFYWWTDSLLDHRNRVTNRKCMTSRMMNTNVTRVITSIIWRSTWSELGASYPKETTDASVIHTTHMKTTTCNIRRTLIILRHSIAYLRIHSNYRQTKSTARHTKRNTNQISEIVGSEMILRRVVPFSLLAWDICLDNRRCVVRISRGDHLLLRRPSYQPTA